MNKQIGSLMTWGGLLVGTLEGCMSASTVPPAPQIAAPAPTVASASGFAAVVPQGPNRIAFPADWSKGSLYARVDRHDIKRYVELYASAGVTDEVRAGRPIPDGARLMSASYMAQVDANGVPLRDAGGHFLKGALVTVGIMQKKAGWGNDIPAAIRNGDWMYQQFLPDGQIND